MAHYSLSVRTISTASGSAAAEITASSSRLSRLLSLTFVQAVATQPFFGLGRPAAIGITPTTQDQVLNNDPPDANPGIHIVTAWGTPPTAPTNFFRRISPLNIKGGSFTWSFPYGGLVIPAAGSLVLWNLGLTGVGEITIEVDE